MLKCSVSAIRLASWKAFKLESFFCHRLTQTKAYLSPASLKHTGNTEGVLFPAGF